jgi:peroxiredoxin Q/BCP
LVQLQEHKKDLDDAGLQVAVVSYDDVKKLAAFADAKGIQFPLLSDAGSKTIEAYGILNKEAPAQVQGIPYPGTYVIDKSGVVRAKLFKDGVRDRASAAEVIEAAKSLK